MWLRFPFWLLLSYCRYCRYCRIVVIVVVYDKVYDIDSIPSTLYAVCRRRIGPLWPIIFPNCLEVFGSGVE